MKSLFINGKDIGWTISEDGRIYKRSGEEVLPIPRCKSYPVIRLPPSSGHIHARLDRLVYENFLGGTYDDKIPIFHIDGDAYNCHKNNIHAGFMLDERYPNEKWAKYQLHVNEPIEHDVIVDYWISTYGRCYACNYEMFMKSHFDMYPIRTGDDIIHWVPIQIMIAETFIPNPYQKPYVVIIDRDKPITIDNIGWSYDENKLSGELPDAEDIAELFSPEFSLDHSLYWKQMNINGDLDNPYLISRFGNVYNSCTKHLMTPQLNQTGYWIIKVSGKGHEFDGKYVQLHRLVAMTFIPNPENKPCINHIDGNRQNPRVENLEWCTPKENCEHAVRTGLYHAVYGDDHPGSAVTQAVAEEIIRQYQMGKDPKELGKEYGLRMPLINNIVRGLTYKKLADKYGLTGEKTRRTQYIEEYKPKVKELLDAGEFSVIEICRKLGMEYPKNRGFVSNVKSRYLNGTLII